MIHAAVNGPSSTNVTPTWRASRLLLGRIRRIVRWEFWPTLPLYFPVLPVIILEGIRHRSLSLVTLVNPGMPSGGFVLDSKSAMLRSLESSGRVAAFDVIPRQLPTVERLLLLKEIMASLSLTFPIVLKPDVGERGSGVLIARDSISCTRYLEKATEDIIVQTYIPGVEYGVFYERFPDEKTGRITGITHKSVTLVTGDGRSTLERLILSDARAVAQAPVFLRIHEERLHEIIPEGENVSLNQIGTHSRGSLFLDACHEKTPEMERAIDVASRHFEGFYFGRYDLRCPSIDSLRSGDAFHIVEVNGVTSEPTHMYDPRHGVFYAWKCLAAQWTRAFRIAAINRDSGHRPITLSDLVARIRMSRK